MTKKNKKMHLKESCQGNEGKSEKKMKKTSKQHERKLRMQEKIQEKIQEKGGGRQSTFLRRESFFPFCFNVKIKGQVRPLKKKQEN